MREGAAEAQKQFVGKGQACDLESLCPLNLWAECTFVHFSGERAQVYHWILKRAPWPQMLQNLGVLVSPPLCETARQSQYPEAPAKRDTTPGIFLPVSCVAGAQLSRVQARRSPCKGSRPASPPGHPRAGRRGGKSWGPGRLARSGPGFCAPAQLPAPPCSSRCPGPSVSSAWSSAGCNHFARSGHCRPCTPPAPLWPQPPIWFSL